MRAEEALRRCRWTHPRPRMCGDSHMSPHLPGSGEPTSPCTMTCAAGPCLEPAVVLRALSPREGLGAR